MVLDCGWLDSKLLLFECVIQFPQYCNTHIPYFGARWIISKLQILPDSATSADSSSYLEYRIKKSVQYTTFQAANIAIFPDIPAIFSELFLSNAENDDMGLRVAYPQGLRTLASGSQNRWE